MSEQMSHRRALGAGRFVQIDGTLLGRDQGRVGGEKLRHGAPAEPVLEGAVLGDDPTRGRHTGRGVVGGPRLDLAKRLQGARY